MTSRALVAGLLYVLVWEGRPRRARSRASGSSASASTRWAIADAAGVGGRITSDTLEPATAVLLAAVVVVVALVIAVRRLSAFEIPQAD